MSHSESRVAAPVFDVTQVRAQFPILQQEVNGHPLVYLDNAATTQKPQMVIDAISHYYRHDHSNVHRAAHVLADRATTAFEQARQTTAAFINSASADQVIWTRGTTESINLVAQSYARSVLKPGDRILVSALEHHSNIVPWQLVAEACGAEVLPIPVNNSGDLQQDAYRELLDERVKMVAVNHVSNALGTVNPVVQMIEDAHKIGAKVLIDAAQSVAHFPVDVQALNCDFFAFSGHKVFGPTGIGVLWGRRELLEQMPPYQGGGEMIETVRFSGTTFNTLPYKFEAGTPNIAGAVGLGAALAWLQSQDRQAMAMHESALLAECISRGESIGLLRVGAPKVVAGVYSFLLPGTHPADVGTLLDQQGVAVRTGHHCAQPLMAEFGVQGTVRASFSVYNTHYDLERFFTGLEKVKTFLL